MKNSPGPWPMACGDHTCFPRPFNLLIPWPWAQNPRRRHFAATSPHTRSALFDPRALQGPIFLDSWTPRGRSKNHRFFNPFQNRPRTSKNQPVGIQGFIFHRFSSILVTILASFFCVFAKRRNLQNYCTGQQISRFLAYLCIHFCINFASFFHVFSGTLPGSTFWWFFRIFNQKSWFWAPLGDPRGG